MDATVAAPDGKGVFSSINNGPTTRFCGFLPVNVCVIVGAVFVLLEALVVFGLSIHSMSRNPEFGDFVLFLCSLIPLTSALFGLLGAIRRNKSFLYYSCVAQGFFLAAIFVGALLFAIMIAAINANCDAEDGGCDEGPGLALLFLLFVIAETLNGLVLYAAKTMRGDIEAASKQGAAQSSVA